MPPMPPKPSRILFAHSYWDILPVIFAFVHAAFILALFFLFPRLHWWALIPLGIVYVYSISWNINGISHNFIHNPYFNSPLLNRLFSLFESLLCGFSQVMYECVHRRHHMGNSDRPDANGKTIDWISIYEHGHDGHAENPIVYSLLSPFREDVKQTYREIARLSRREAHWGVFEIILGILFAIAGLIFNWKAMLFLLACIYLGQAISALQGYYRHYGANPDEPVAWGVSSYHKLYNFVWFNNGYHGEHHFRPRVHWTKMAELHEQIKAEQIAKGARVIGPPHAFAFLDPEIRKLHKADAQTPQTAPSAK